MIDYLNFKGEGIANQENYKGKGWGLLQVLQEMSGNDGGMAAIEAFIASGKKVLARRIENSPPERGELRWLKGWNHRLDKYLIFAMKLDQESSH